MSSVKFVGVKFCGGCNPQIDRGKVFRQLKNLLPENYCVAPLGEREEWDTGLLICGCAVACADRPEVRKKARRWILVSGEMVDFWFTPEAEIASVVAQKLQK